MLDGGAGRTGADARRAIAKAERAAGGTARAPISPRSASRGSAASGPKRTLELEPTAGLTLVIGRNGRGKSSFAEGGRDPPDRHEFALGPAVADLEGGLAQPSPPGADGRRGGLRHRRPEGRDDAHAPMGRRRGTSTTARSSRRAADKQKDRPRQPRLGERRRDVPAVPLVQRARVDVRRGADGIPRSAVADPRSRRHRGRAAAPEAGPTAGQAVVDDAKGRLGSLLGQLERRSTTRAPRPPRTALKGRQWDLDAAERAPATATDGRRQRRRAARPALPRRASRRPTRTRSAGSRPTSRPLAEREREIAAQPAGEARDVVELLQLALAAFRHARRGRLPGLRQEARAPAVVERPDGGADRRSANAARTRPTTVGRATLRALAGMSPALVQATTRPARGRRRNASASTRRPPRGMAGVRERARRPARCPHLSRDRALATAARGLPRPGPRRARPARGRLGARRPRPHGLARVGSRRPGGREAGRRPEGSRGVAQGHERRDPRRTLRADRRRGHRALALLRQQSSVELERVDARPAPGPARQREDGRHHRRRRERGARRHEPGRAARDGAEPVPAARDAAREPVPLRRHRRPRPVDGSRPRRRARARPRGGREGAPGHRLHARRPAARVDPAPRHRRPRDRGDAAREFGGRPVDERRPGRSGTSTTPRRSHRTRRARGIWRDRSSRDICRAAIEAQAIEIVRRRRIGRGEAHADVDKLLETNAQTRPLLALALFDNAGRGGEVGGKVGGLGHVGAEVLDTATAARTRAPGSCR